MGLILNDDSQVVDVTSETAPPTEDICQDIPHGFVSEPRPLSTMLPNVPFQHSASVTPTRAPVRAA